MLLPTGKGILVWIIARCAGGNPLRVAQMAAQAGLAWVALKIHDGGSDYNGNLLPHVLALRAAGIAVWGWGYCYGFSVPAEAAVIVRRMNELQLDGYLLNAEHQWKAAGMRTRASLLMKEIRRGLGPVPIGLCSYRYPDLHGQFPWAEFLAESDFHMPQVYWLEDSRTDQPAKQLARSLVELRARRDLPVIPLGVASPNDAGTWIPTVEQLDNFYEGVKAQGLSGWGWWEWGHAEKHPDWWAAIAEHGPPLPPSISALADEISALAENIKELGA